MGFVESFVDVRKGLPFVDSDKLLACCTAHVENDGVP